MSKSVKKVISLCLSMVLVFSLAFTALAATIRTGIDGYTIDKVNSALNYVSNQKEQYGLGDVDFSTLSIGNAIPTYEYTNDALSPLAISYYPLTSNGDLVALATIANDSANITTALVDKIKSEVTSDEPFALVFDKNTCYVYTDAGLSSIANFEDVNSRATINNSEAVVVPEQLESYTAIQSIGRELSSSATNIGTPLSIASSAYVSLNVPFVTQNYPSAICWAACAACIGNYLKPSATHYTAYQVAVYVYGPTNWNQGASDATAVAALNSLYGVSYTAHTGCPSDNTMLASLNAGLPLYSGWSSPKGGHSMVICGIDVLAGYISVMDPAYGFASAQTNGYTYTYVAAYAGTTATMDGYGN